MSEMRSARKVAVVIVNWERPEDTIQCVRSVMDADYPDIDLILVDNGSSDDSIAQFKAELGQISIIELPENQGFTGGYNAGIVKALELASPFIFFPLYDFYAQPV